MAVVFVVAEESATSHGSIDMHSLSGTSVGLQSEYVGPGACRQVERRLTTHHSLHCAG
jgi:hypothetical protein